MVNKVTKKTKTNQAQSKLKRREAMTTKINKRSELDIRNILPVVTVVLLAVFLIFGFMLQAKVIKLEAGYKYDNKIVAFQNAIQENHTKIVELAAQINKQSESVNNTFKNLSGEVSNQLGILDRRIKAITPAPIKQEKEK